MKKISVLTLLVFATAVTSLMAQSRHYNSMTLGMGGGGTAYADGYHANFINPANLMLDMHRPRNTFGFVGGVGVKAGGSMLNVHTYNKYLTNNLTIDGQVRESMLNDWFGSSSNNTRNIAAAVSAVPLGYAHRGVRSSFSAAFRVRVEQDLNINKGMAEFISYGLDSELLNNNPLPVNFTSNSVSFAEISVGYARHITTLPNLLFARDIKIYAGVAPKFLYGVYTAKFDFNSTLSMQEATADQPFGIHHQFNYSLQSIGVMSEQLRAFEAAYNMDSATLFEPYQKAIEDNIADDLLSPQAYGFGLDLGGTVEMDISEIPIPLFINKKKTLRLSMSLTDLGKLNFDNASSDVHAEGEVNYIGLEGDEPFDTYFENLADSLQKDVYGKFNSDPTDGVAYSLPAMYNFGSSLEMGRLLIALDYGVGFNNNGVNSKRSVLNLGLQYKTFGFMPIRLGTRIGGYSSVSYSAGLGLDFDRFEFSFGGSMYNNTVNSGAAAGFAWSGFVFRF